MRRTGWKLGAEGRGSCFRCSELHYGAVPCAVANEFIGACVWDGEKHSLAWWHAKCFMLYFVVLCWCILLSRVSFLTVCSIRFDKELEHEANAGLSKGFKYLMNIKVLQSAHDWAVAFFLVGLLIVTHAVTTGFGSWGLLRFRAPKDSMPSGAC